MNNVSIDTIEQPDDLKQVGLQLLSNAKVVSARHTSGDDTGNFDFQDKTSFHGFKQKGDLIFVLGTSDEDLNGSVYLSDFHNRESDKRAEATKDVTLALNDVISGLIDNEHINAAHACGCGGVFAALIEMSAPLELGFDIVTDSEVREDAFLFGETPARALVTVSEDQEDEFIEFMIASQFPFTLLGHVTKGKLMVDDAHYGFIQDYKTLYKRTLRELN
jgi:phosphoribosylformylglycinamidine synthase